MQKKKYKRKMKKSVFIISLVSFFIARAVLFDSINPVCIAFLGCFCGGGSNLWTSFIMTAIGLITNSGGIYLSKYLISAIFVLIFNTILQKKIKYSSGAKAFTSSASILSGGLIMAMLNDFSLYYTVTSVLESILTFAVTIIFDTGIRFLTERKKRIVASQEEMISLSLIASSIIIGAADIHIGDVPIVYALCIALTMFVSYCTHAAVGASAAIFAGLLLIMSRNAPSESAVILAGASAAAGAYNKKYKSVFIIIYVAVGAFMLYFLKNSMFDMSMLISAVIGISLFAVIPPQAAYIFRNSSEDDTSDTDAYIERLKDVTKHKLKRFSSSFEKLARTFSVLSEKRSSLDKNDISRLIDDISDRTCKKCDMRY
ncbi:MAG: hypothetical protein IJ736_06455, partial [Firmicutes bacterium]|nr:hypothetical protein [Bacillota bacterium]